MAEGKGEAMTTINSAEHLFEVVVVSYKGVELARWARFGESLEAATEAAERACRMEFPDTSYVLSVGHHLDRDLAYRLLVDGVNP